MMNMDFFELLLKPPYIYILAFGLVLMILGIVLRMISGAVNTIPASVSASFLIIFIYVVAALLIRENAQTKIFVNALPFWGQVDDATQIFSLMQGNFGTFLIEISHMLMLAIIVNILQQLTEGLAKPNHRMFIVRFIIWYMVQVLTVVAALLINAFLTYEIRKHIPEKISQWIPAILAGILTVLMILVALKSIFSLLNPFLGMLFDFFMGNTFGRILTKSFLTTAAIALFVYIAQHFGWFLPLVEGGILVNSFGPVILLLVLLWYVVWFFI